MREEFKNLKKSSRVLCNFKGFSLIEIVIGMALSSIISLVLYNLLNQSTKVVDNVSSFISLDNKVAIFYNQINKTLSASYIPVTELPKNSLTTTLSTNTTTTSSQNTDQKKNNNVLDTQNKSDKQEPQAKKKLEKIFYSENDGANLKLLTFISTGALRAYGQTGANLTRVVYRLIKDPQNNGYYKLLIQQNSKIVDLDILKSENSKTRSYEILTGIKSFKAIYWAREVLDQNAKEQPKNITYSKLSDWGSKEMLEKYKQQIPEYVELVLEVWDDKLKRSKNINFKFKIYAYKEAEIKPDNKQDKKQNSQTQTDTTRSINNNSIISNNITNNNSLTNNNNSNSNSNNSTINNNSRSQTGINTPKTNSNSTSPNTIISQNISVNPEVSDITNIDSDKNIVSNLVARDGRPKDLPSWMDWSQYREPAKIPGVSA